MNLNLSQIEQAFGSRSLPVVVVESTALSSTERDDALWFTGRGWKEIAWDDWESHRDALYAFSPAAFAYYLPSIVSLSCRFPEKWFWPVDSLLRVIDRSPVVEYWDAFVVTRLIGLQHEEYQVLKSWLLLLADHSEIYAGVDIGRAFDTVDLIQAETERIRLMVKPKGNIQ